MQVKDGSTRSDVRSLAPLLLGAIMLRILWLYASGGFGRIDIEESGEATRVAVSLALGNGFADALPGLGPTAHVLPLTPLLAGGILWLTGPAGPLAAPALTLWALAQMIAAYATLYRLFREIGVARTPLRVAILILCVVPVFAPEEATAFRYWDGALGTALGAYSLTLLLRCWRGRPLTMRGAMLVAAIASLCFLVSPPVGVASGACWAVFALRRLSFRQCLTLGTLTALAIAAWMIPWTLRNVRVMGEPVPVRSNFGLELAIGNHPAALSDGDPEGIFRARLRAIHPFHGVAANARAGAMGEIAYARMLGRDTEHWIARHPAGFARLCLRHYAQLFFPAPWLFAFSQSDILPVARSIAICLVDALGLIALAHGLYRRRAGYAVLALYLATVALPYALVQPVPRYTYLVYAMLCVLAVDGVGRIGRSALRLRRQ